MLDEWDDSCNSPVRAYGCSRDVPLSYQYQELTYFFLAARALQNCGIQFDLQNNGGLAAERPCKYA